MTYFAKMYIFQRIELLIADILQRAPTYFCMRPLKMMCLSVTNSLKLLHIEKVNVSDLFSME